MRKLMYCLTSVMVLVMLTVFPIGVVQANKCELPNFASAKFSDPLTIDNAYFPLVPGTTFIYEPVPNDDNVVDTVEVTFDYHTITVDGKNIDCRVVHDYETEDEKPSEYTDDWYAQDDDGNVWYCGEDTTVFLYDEDGNPIGTDKTGSWEAGKDVANLGEIAQPGYLIRAADDLTPGICYQQEYYDDVAQDMAKVLRLNAKVDLENGDSYEDCLMTKEWAPVELGDIEQKFYAKDVGLVLNFEHRGKIVRYELISVNP